MSISVSTGVGYEKLKRKIIESIIEGFWGRLEVVDIIPVGSNLGVIFDENVPAGTTGEVSMDAPSGTKLVVQQIVLQNAAEATGNVYLKTGAGELKLIEDTKAKGRYVVDVDEVIGVVRADSIILRCKTLSDTSRINTVRMYYSGLVVKS